MTGHTKYLPKYRNNKNIVVVIYILLLALLSMSYVNDQNSIVFPAAIAISLVAALVLGWKYSVVLMISAYQFTLWVPYIHITILVAVLFLFHNYRKLPPLGPTMWYVVVLILSSISLLQPNATIDYYLRVVVSELAVVFLFSTETTVDIDITAIKAFCLAFYFKFGVMFFAFSKYATIDYALQYRFGQSALKPFLPENLLIQNENSLATFCALTITLLYVLRNKKNGPYIGSFTYVICIIASVIVGFLTKSRTFVFSMMFFMMFVFFTTRSNMKRKMLKVFVCLITILISCLIVKALLPTVFEGVIDRFKVDDLANGRSDTFKSINEIFFSGNTLGVLFGYLAVEDYVDVLGFPDAFHNLIQSFYVTRGIVGFIAVLGLLVSSFTLNRSKVNGRLDLMFFLPCVTILVAGVGLDPHLIMLLFCIFVLRAGREDLSKTL